MAKLTYWSAILAAGTGLIFLLPLHSVQWLSFSTLLIFHITFAVVLLVMLVRLLYTHIPMELSNPFKRGVKKWNGFKLFLYLSLAIISGIIIILFHLHWVIYFHGFIGLWAILVGRKHTH